MLKRRPFSGSVPALPAPLPRPGAAPGRLALALLGCWLLAAPAQAITRVASTLHSDGSGPFDPSAGPGFDTGPNNGVVRTNDTLTYNVSVTANGTESGIIITLTLPLVGGEPAALWPQVPAYCVAGSALSADGRTLTCALAPLGSPGSQTATDVLFTARVLGTVPNGTVLPAPTITVTAPGTVPAPSSVPAPVTVSAAPFYDVVVQMSYNGNPQAYGFSAASGPANEAGFFSRPMVGLVARHPNGHGRKGVEALSTAQPVRLTLNLPDSTLLDNYHTGTAPYGTPAAAPDFQDGCGSPGSQPSLESGAASTFMTACRTWGLFRRATPTQYPTAGSATPCIPLATPRSRLN
ncbi:hypothetical protein ACFP81_05365 [Deinococcus lacus]|uniref:DUF11 domain-containing protein n=1 Tax=Deinococcus lacus TaxID=392561 RepID=A0ABW1YB15_9DEIO